MGVTRLLSLIAITFVGKSSSLKCSQGYEVPILATSKNITECPNTLSQRCIRAEAEVAVLGTTVQVNAELCVDVTSCRDRSCQSLADEIIMHASLPRLPSYEIRSCSYACCNSDKCNENTVSRIKAAQRTTTSTTTSTAAATSTKITMQTTSVTTTYVATATIPVTNSNFDQTNEYVTLSSGTPKPIASWCSMVFVLFLFVVVLS